MSELAGPGLPQARIALQRTEERARPVLDFKGGTRGVASVGALASSRHNGPAGAWTRTDSLLGVNSVGHPGEEPKKVRFPGSARRVHFAFVVDLEPLPTKIV
jgi:hypothetical protein